MRKGLKISLFLGVLISCGAVGFFLLGYQKFLPDNSIQFKALTASEIKNIRQHSPITSVKVYKAKRQLILLHQQKKIKTYPMRLGFNPIGHKTQEGDGKTPEGHYILDWRNPKSVFYKSLHISYPNQADLAQAKARGVDVGGDVMIHGSAGAKTAKLPEMMDYMPKKDWTWGCIAVSNHMMDEIWNLVDNGTPIEILP